MHYIVGLGNPGGQYDDTRHNVGFMFIDFLRDHHNLPQFVYSGKHSGMIIEGVLPGGEVLLLKPDTYMNNSGSAVKKIVSKENVKDLIVVYDDVDLPLGEIKVSVSRGDGGHNGIRSIINSLGSKDFIRIRIGISQKSFWSGKVKRPDSARLSAHVLGHFKGKEIKELEEVFKQADEALSTILSQGIIEAMNKYN